MSPSYWNLPFFLLVFGKPKPSILNRKQTFMRVKICIFLFCRFNFLCLKYHKNERTKILLRQNYKDRNAILYRRCDKIIKYTCPTHHNLYLGENLIILSQIELLLRKNNVSLPSKTMNIVYENLKNKGNNFIILSQH